MAEENSKQQKANGNGRNIVARLYFPNNDNLVPMLRSNLGDDLMAYAETMIKDKDYHQQIVPINGGSAIELVSCRGEDIARKIIENANHLEVGITGSDFVLANVLSRHEQFYRFKREIPILGISALGRDLSYTELRVIEAGILYVRDLGDIIKDDLEPGATVRFAGEKYCIDMIILKHTGEPSVLRVVGANDMQYDEVIRKRKEQKRKVNVAYELRFEPLVCAFLAREARIQGVDFDTFAYSGTTEAHLRHGEEPEEEGRADIGIDIVQTGETLRQNNLIAYKGKEIMRTYPVQVTCYTIEDRRERLSLEKIRGMISKTHSVVVPY